jgi:thiol-disulfide isomerase/thioredoxin
MRKLLIGLMLLIILCLIGYSTYYYFTGKTPQEETGTSDAIGVSAGITLKELDVKLLELGGSTKSISEYSKGIVLLNFWATWCGYCEKEMPDLIRLDKKMRAEGTGMVVAIDVNEKETIVQKYINEQGFSGLTVLLDLQGIAAKKFNIEGYPTTFAFKDGLLVDYQVGMMTWDEMLKMLEEASN